MLAAESPVNEVGGENARKTGMRTVCNFVFGYWFLKACAPRAVFLLPPLLPVKVCGTSPSPLTFGDALRELVQEQPNICDETDGL